jgi:ABC-type uncharacterized transport system substrate-binding protein
MRRGSSSRGWPDVVVSGGATTTGPLLQATSSVPVVFTSAVDPVGAGFVESLAQPGGNATGFMQFDFSLSGKWLELLKQVAPASVRAGRGWRSNGSLVGRAAEGPLFCVVKTLLAFG